VLRDVPSILISYFKIISNTTMEMARGSSSSSSGMATLPAVQSQLRGRLHVLAHKAQPGSQAFGARLFSRPDMCLPALTSAIDTVITIIRKA
jgi:hypothetical protein